MQIPNITEVKDRFEKIKSEGLISEWSLPYENILTRISAAIFFFSPKHDSVVDEIVKNLKDFPGFDFSENTEKKLSQLKYRVTFDLGFVLGRGYIGENEAVKDPNYQRI